MTLVHPAGGPHSLYSKVLFLSRSLLLYYYFLLCLGRTAADYGAVETHGGGGCHAMIFAAARAIFWPILISKNDSNIYLIRFTFEKDEDRGSAFCVVL